MEVKKFAALFAILQLGALAGGYLIWVVLWLLWVTTALTETPFLNWWALLPVSVGAAGALIFWVAVVIDTMVATDKEEKDPFKRLANILA